MNTNKIVLIALLIALFWGHFVRANIPLEMKLIQLQRNMIELQLQEQELEHQNIMLEYRPDSDKYGNKVENGQSISEEYPVILTQIDFKGGSGDYTDKVTLIEEVALRNEPHAKGKIRIATVTAYSCEGITTEKERLMNCPNGVTTDGSIPDPKKTVACDRKLLGKKVLIEGIGEKICQDTGSAIGKDKIDLYVSDLKTAYQWGVKELEYTILSEK